MNTLFGQSNHPNAATMPAHGPVTVTAKESISPRSRDCGYTEANGLATGTADEQADNNAQWQLQSLAALLELLNRIGSFPTRHAACRTLADELQRFLGCQQVVIGWCKDGTQTCQVEAISQVDRFHQHNPEVVMARSVLQESVARGEMTLWPAIDASRRYGLKAHEQYAAMRKADIVLASPLSDESGRVCGVCLVTAGAGTWDQDKIMGFLRAASTPMGTTLRLITRAESGRLVSRSKNLLQQLRSHRGVAILSVLILAIAAMFVPVPFRVKCDCQLEPVTRRFVAAPFDGPLQETLVEPGDIVTKGQLLARMDGREIRWELAGVRAERFRVTKERAGHVASHAAGDAEIARHEVDRLRYREELLTSRDQHLEIRSPIDGIIVSGELQDSAGMPLAIGEVLFEVAPLDRMNVDVAVPEDDMPYVAPGMAVRVVLDAFPTHSYASQVQRVHPRAELIDDQNVFVADMSLDNPHQKLLPGMQGRARITAGTARLGWIIFRRPAATVLEWLGW